MILNHKKKDYYNIASPAVQKEVDPWEKQQEKWIMLLEHAGVFCALN